MTMPCFAIIGLLLMGTEGYLTPDFREFLVQNYDEATARALERWDLYGIGSFGGRTEKDQEVKNKPIIFVHGSTLSAGFFDSHRRFFLARDYNSAELYATTYGYAGLKKNLFTKIMDCENVQNVRKLIQAVHEYTNSTVDVLAFSMGTAISRKAILGGECVDTKENLGEPITDIVDTFIAIGGVAYGMEHCHHKNWESCNVVNGMKCTSLYLRDVNKPTERYEGRFSYGIYSKDDPVIGKECCGHDCAALKNANQNFLKNGLEHGGIILQTKELQYNLFKKHAAERRRRGN
ncbi:unnamed protein product [Bursaphelenchus xylophilus]|uniref:(pine wood nematode) hypothetical protein n=1 Tax=Bursaphelenchus xylophilus TaxID=6326 RepID=A0A1I7RIU7_BURXY|nr:unnamed protein product [Bursaphelenchus xylophilus]CAG9119104.1 unnamed protein product [Bursaphelenchus xylophilus]